MLIYGCIWYFMDLHGIAWHSIVLHVTALYRMVLCSFKWYYIILNGFASYLMLLHGISCHCTLLRFFFGIKWYWIVFHCAFDIMVHLMSSNVLQGIAFFWYAYFVLHFMLLNAITLYCNHSENTHFTYGVSPRPQMCFFCYLLMQAIWGCICKFTVE